MKILYLHFFHATSQLFHQRTKNEVILYLRNPYELFVISLCHNPSPWPQPPCSSLVHIPISRVQHHFQEKSNIGLIWPATYFVPINKILSKIDLEKHPSGSEFTNGKPTDAALLGALWPRLGEMCLKKNATQYSWKFTMKDLRIGQPYSSRKRYHSTRCFSGPGSSAFHQRAAEASSWPQTSVGDVKAGEGRTTTRTG